MLDPILVKNDKKAKTLIFIVSVVVFIAIVVLDRVQISVGGDFDAHVFARINAVINTVVSLLLIAAFVAVKRKNYLAHKRLMLAAIALSALFLASYICHHLLAGNTKYGGEGTMRYIYYFILITHIFLAAIILPLILFTAYRALIAEWPQHKRLARITWPVWLYVSITGPLTYLLISPYY